MQKQAYLGNNIALREHMLRNSKTTMTTASVRSWLERNGGLPTGYTNAYYSLADLDIDHILPKSVGGQDHPYNYVLLPKKLNNSLSGWYTFQKEGYIGRAAAKDAKNFFVWARDEGKRLGVNCNDFHQKRLSM